MGSLLPGPLRKEQTSSLSNGPLLRRSKKKKKKEGPRNDLVGVSRDGVGENRPPSTRKACSDRAQVASRGWSVCGASLLPPWLS